MHNMIKSITISGIQKRSITCSIPTPGTPLAAKCTDYVLFVPR